MLAPAVSQHKWRTACQYALILSGAFLSLSLVMLGIGIESNLWHAIGPGLYFIGAVGVFFVMVRSGGALAPIAWYVLGTGVYFGLGTALWGLVPDLHNYGVLRALPGDLISINLLNSASIFLVLFFALFFSARRIVLPLSASVQELNWLMVYKLVLPLVVISVALDYYYFPVAEDLLIRSFQSKLSLVVPLYLLMTGFLWKRIRFGRKALASLIVSCIVIQGVLTFSKTAVIYPLLCTLAGYWVVNRSFKYLITPLLGIFFLLIFVLMPLAKEGRAHINYDDAKNSPFDRSEIVSNNYERREAMIDSEPSIQALARFSHAPFQFFLINEHLAGRSGNTLADFWVALVPRVLWPEKPNVTRFGSELHELFFKTRGARSALAPTYSAEAYWNYGVFGVLIISILLGLQLGWLTKHWFYSIQGHRQAYLIVAFPAAYYGLNVETWIAASYFGGFITMVIIWWLVEFLVPMLENKKQRKGFTEVAS